MTLHYSPPPLPCAPLLSDDDPKIPRLTLPLPVLGAPAGRDHSDGAICVTLPPFRMYE
jgi:hypothetical protein